MSGERLTGPLTVQRGDEVVDGRVLEGRRMSLSIPDQDVTATLHPAPTAAKEHGLAISVTGPEGPEQGVLVDGEHLVAGDLTFSYTTDRTRMLQLISQG